MNATDSATDTNVPSFSRFRSGTPVRFPSGEQMTYSKLKESGLQEHYIRIVYGLITKEEVKKAQVERWLTQAASKDRAVGRQVRVELEARQPKPVIPAQPTSKLTDKVSLTRKRKSEKLLTLVSKGNHKEALKAAHDYNLSPIQIAEAALRPGQSADAHTVQAAPSVASKLITTGYWATQ